MKGRLESLDAFRGFTVIGMIIVNTPGSWSHVFPPLRHAEWHGLTPTDLVFPFFLFIVGVSVVLAYTRLLDANTPRSDLLLKVARRTLLIFLLGLLLNLVASQFEHFRIPGVLQRIALVFLACSLLFLYTDARRQALAGIGLLAGYYLLMLLVPVPGAGAGVWQPGQNLAAWIDSRIIPFHLYRGTWDPEGLLSTLPAIASGISGMLAGHLVLVDRGSARQTGRLGLYGLAMLLAGVAWSWVFPINKNLWTSSYVLVTSGLAAMTLAALMWLIDLKGIRSWALPGIVFGTNAITAYVLSYLVLVPLTWIALPGGRTLQGLFMDGLMNAGVMPELVSLGWAILVGLLCLALVWALYARKVFIKI